MVPKPDCSKRLCVDYRSLNDCTTDASWPIPNISEMFRRIALQKPTIFGLMNLTQGYHQAPLTQSAKIYTAFILFCGVYQFTRLPFGLRRAPSYFQQTMATVVLAGLLYVICEVYLDDVNVFVQNSSTGLNKFSNVSDFTKYTWKLQNVTLVILNLTILARSSLLARCLTLKSNLWLIFQRRLFRSI